MSVLLQGHTNNQHHGRSIPQPYFPKATKQNIHQNNLFMQLLIYLIQRTYCKQPHLKLKIQEKKIKIPCKQFIVKRTKLVKNHKNMTPRKNKRGFGWGVYIYSWKPKNLIGQKTFFTFLNFCWRAKYSKEGVKLR